MENEDEVSDSELNTSDEDLPWVRSSVDPNEVPYYPIDHTPILEHVGPRHTQRPGDRFPYMIRNINELSSFLKCDMITELSEMLKCPNSALISTRLCEYLASVVPRIYAPINDSTDLCQPNHNEQAILSYLLEPLECLLVGDLVNFTEAIKKTDSPTESCKRVFKPNESTYTCRQCAADPTCFMCVECFNLSEHKHHRYKMSTSLGGGCCDCGDCEAWFQFSHCSKHVQHAGAEVNPMLPEMRERALQLLQVLIIYANDVLSNQYCVRSDAIKNFRPTVLPADEPFTVILYNDEVHTFELVIQILMRTLLIERSLAEEFAHKVDREGRAIIKVAPFKECHNLKSTLELLTVRPPLRVDIRQATLVAHQFFAIKLITWLTDILEHSSGFREIFDDIVLRPREIHGELYYAQIIKEILMNDTKYWKSARKAWHLLLMAGLCKEYSYKLNFGEVFARCYDSIMVAFAEDDQDQNCSVTSLSVQMFSSPSIGQHLMMEQNLLWVIMTTMLYEIEYNIEGGKLTYVRKNSKMPLKVSQYCLLDLKYLLIPSPYWQPTLMSRFLAGFGVFVEVLGYLQESDFTFRKYGQHVQYDADWEIAFNLHVKLAPVMVLIVQWCASDRQICIKAYRRVMKAIYKLVEDRSYSMPTRSRALAKHKAECYIYNLEKSSVSIYLGLSRLCALLFIELCKHDVSKADLEPINFFPLPEQVLEAPMRTMVLVAQYHTGWWKRNGVSLTNQIHFYEHVRYRGDMLDLDVLALQTIATQMEPNEFLIRLLDRFDLMEWPTMHFQASCEYLEAGPALELKHDQLILAEEFLLLIIALVGGRFFPPVGAVTVKQCVAKRVMQGLCMGPQTHSQINKFLYEDFRQETGIESVLLEVANCRKGPKGDIYELKSEFYEDYDVFYSQYTREEMAKAEDHQRARKLAAKEPDFHPPPKLPKLCEPFTSLLYILSSDVFMHICKMLIQRCTSKLTNVYTDGQIRKCFHLIGYALDEESPAYSHSIRTSMLSWSIPKALNTLLQAQDTANYKVMISWILKKMAEKNILELDIGVPALVDDETTKVDTETERRKALAAAAKERKLASISLMQRNFLTMNKDLLESDIMTDDTTDETLETETEAVCLGSKKTQAYPPEEWTCILCLEKVSVQSAESVFIMPCFVQNSTVLAQGNPEENVTPEGYLVSKHLPAGNHIMSCGHILHSNCWAKYYEKILARERRRQYQQVTSFDISKLEALCPLCETIHNAIMPVLPPVRTDLIPVESVSISYDDWICYIYMMSRRIILGQQNSLITSTPSQQQYADDMFMNKAWYNPRGKEISLHLEFALEEFGNRVMEMGIIVEDGSQQSHFVSVWNAIAYTVTATELSNREQQVPFFGEEVPLRQQLTLRYLIRIGATIIENCSACYVAVRTIGLRLVSTLCHAKCPDAKGDLAISMMDPMSILVNLTFSLPFLFTYSAQYSAAYYCSTTFGGIMDKYIFKTVMLLHIVQLLLDSKVTEVVKRMSTKRPLEKFDPNIEPYECFLRQVLKIDDSMSVPCDAILAYLEDALTPFVAACCKFYECLTDIIPTGFLPQGTPLKIMLRYLGQSADIRTVFDCPLLVELGTGWAQTMGDINIKIQYPLKIQELYPLPNDYLELLNSAIGFSCPTAKAVGVESRNPTICLKCGEIVCSLSPCCQVTDSSVVSRGGCQAHSVKCGKGLGMFLRIRDSTAFILSGLGTGAFVCPPYVDEYGETDHGLKRGNPLRISTDRLSFFRKLWITHSIPEEVARVTERSISTAEMGAVVFPDWTSF